MRNTPELTGFNPDRPLEGLKERIAKARKLDQLKRDAKRLKKATPDMTHAEALDQVAHGQGFANYNAMHKALK